MGGCCVLLRTSVPSPVVMDSGLDGVLDWSWCRTWARTKDARFACYYLVPWWVYLLCAWLKKKRLVPQRCTCKALQERRRCFANNRWLCFSRFWMAQVPWWKAVSAEGYETRESKRWVFYKWWHPISGQGGYQNLQGVLATVQTCFHLW